LHGCDKARYNPRAQMSNTLLDDEMTAQVVQEWERFRKALALRGDIGPLGLDELRIVAERDRRGVPPAISIPALQALLKLEKSGLRGQAIRGGEEIKERTRLEVAKAQATELRIQDAEHSEVYGALAYYASRRLGLTESQALVFGDATAYLMTGWSQTHTDGRYTDRLIMEFKKKAGSPPGDGFLWSDLQSLACRGGFRIMVERASQIGTPFFR
jgi:hypothetical protein